jgi:hypothetical protein
LNSSEKTNLWETIGLFFFVFLEHASGGNATWTNANLSIWAGGCSIGHNETWIRTRLEISSLLVSESVAHSDTDSSFKPYGVRIRGSFGHELLILALCCPNQGLIRTRIAYFSLFVSESGSHSDTDSSFKPYGVRIRVSFGHELLILALCCPNQGLNRTRIAYFSLFVSESGSHSDTDSSFKPYGVRIRVSFGHELLILALCCPNQGLIRTRITHFSLMLSESGSHSDKDSLF